MPLYTYIFLNAVSVPCLFSMTENKPHSIQKRMISNVYSKSHLQSSPEMHKLSQVMIFERLLPIVEAAAVKKIPTDVLELNLAAAGDFINAYLFGLSSSTNWLQDIETRKFWLNKHQIRQPHRFWPQELPGVSTFLNRFGIHIVPKWVDTANQEIEAYNLQMCEAAEKSTTEGPTPQSDDEKSFTPPVVWKQLSDSLVTTSSKLPSSTTSPHPHTLRIATELLDHSAAGFDTSGITLTYLFHELSLRPTLQTSLRTELLSLSPHLIYPSHSHSLPSPRALDALPLLHAILMETLRLHSVIPGPQPRITPSTPTSLAGSSPLPGGIRVSAQAYSLHRNEEVFPSSEEWRPERWLDAGKEKTAEMMKWFWAFGSGGRMCIGSNFAMQGKPLFSLLSTTTHITSSSPFQKSDSSPHQSTQTTPPTSLTTKASSPLTPTSRLRKRTS